MSEGYDRIRQWETGPVRHRTTKRHKKETLTAGERRRLTQLLVCLFLFGIVFLGRGAPEGHLRAAGDTLGQWVHQNTDFRAAFSKVGKSVSDGEPVVETFGLLWSEIFGTSSNTPERNGAESATTTEGDGGTLPVAETKILPGVGEAGQSQAQGESTVQPPTAQQPATQQSSQQATQQPSAATQPPAPAATPPAQAKTSAASKLLEEETVTPVMGVLTSGFGYRIHPIDGQWKEHEGIDIMADEGTPIKAFAAGTVDYVGESPAYGMYLQLKHDNGVSSFYAHCSALLIKKGQKVGVGEAIAKVGSTGVSTAPHLHLELKKDGVRVDPALYVKTLSQ